MEIAVMGATGNVGSELVALLVALGHRVRALTSRGRTPANEQDGVRWSVVDLNHGATLRDVLHGADGAFMLSGYDDVGLITELERASVPRVALLSSGAVGTAGASNAVAAYHRASEQALRDSSLGWTFVRPSTFMSNSLAWADAIRDGEPVVAPFADVPIATNDPRDVAAVAAAALTSGEHEERVYRVTGPEALLPAERVQILGDLLGRELRFEAQSNEAARTEMEGSMPSAYVDAFFELFVEGKNDETMVLPTVGEVTGTEPRRFRDWAIEHIEAFR
jgi:uncharacterized protein YbjT (DUF2867 family)